MYVCTTLIDVGVSGVARRTAVAPRMFQLLGSLLVPPGAVRKNKVKSRLISLENAYALLVTGASSYENNSKLSLQKGLA